MTSGRRTFRTLSGDLVEVEVEGPALSAPACDHVGTMEPRAEGVACVGCGARLADEEVAVLVAAWQMDQGLEPCPWCGHPFDQERLGPVGCPNCHGEGLE